MTQKELSDYIIKPADFNDPQIISLLQTHHATVTNPDSNVAGQKMYALDITDLRDNPDIQLWTIWTSTKPQILGCAALKKLSLSDDVLAGEVKSMHTIAAARSNGIGALLVAKLVTEAREMGMTKLYLETGSQEAFSKARRFYSQQGFQECGRFGDYEEQENSVFMYRDI